MQYHVAKNGEKSGPFEKEEVLRRLVAGELSGDDLAWSEGMTDWEPLSKLIPPPLAASTASAPVFASASSAPSLPASSNPSTSGLAIGSLICGIASFFCLGLSGLPAVIMGHMALSRIKKSGGTLGGKGLAIGGLVTGYIGFFIVGIAVLASLAVPAYSGIQQKANQIKAINNARQLVLGMKQYSLQHDGSLPPDLEALFTEKIIEDRRVLEVPGTRVKTTPDTAWEYRGAGIKDSGDAKTIILISRESYRRDEHVVARLDGSADVTRGDHAATP